MDKRTLLTVVLCFAAIVLWHNFIWPMIRPPQEQPTETQRPLQPGPDEAAGRPAQREEIKPAGTTPGEASPAGTEQAQRPPVSEKQPEVQASTLENKYITLKLTNVGGTISEAYLNEYDEDVSHREPLRLLAPIKDGERSLAVELEPEQSLAGRRFNVLAADERKVVYQTRLPSGLRVTKTIELPEDAYNALMTVKLENLSGGTVKVAYWATSAAGIMPDLPDWQKKSDVPLTELKSRFIEGGIGMQPADPQAMVKVIRRAPAKVQEQAVTEKDNTVVWVGLKNRYFSAVLKPLAKGLVVGGKISSLGGNNVTASLESRIITLPPNGSAADEYLFFVGPNSKKIMANPAYEEFAHFHAVPMPAPVTKLFIGILYAFYTVVGNYGAAIIMLTLVVRACLHPLSRKSQKSMHGMQKLSPKMKEVKTKYKDDKKRQQEEMMKLYREHGVNPMGGCLPILLQLPILIGLFGALRSAIELRHAPFCLWMKDLSQPDALMILPSDWAFVGGSPLNILPILMIVAMVLQQKLTPRPGGDAQAEQTHKMMMWLMPVMFGFLFYGMPSGLVLYFMTSTGLGALESHLIRRHLEKVEAPSTRKQEKKKQESWVERAARAKAGRSRRMK